MPTTTKKKLKMDYQREAATKLVRNLVRPIDRTMVMSCGSDTRIECDFTPDTSEVQAAITSLGYTNKNEKTAYLDSLGYAAIAFRKSARRNAAWLIVASTDGHSNADREFSDPAECGTFLRRCFNFHPTNFLRIVGVGADIDRKALGTLAEYARCSAITLTGFDEVERLFLDISLQITHSLVGARYSAGPFTWDELYRVRQLHSVPIDLCENSETAQRARLIKS
jgi:hypothetical protein